MKTINKQAYWFKRRRYGYGWTPVTWQGRVIISVFLATIFGGMFILKDTPKNTFSKELVEYLAIVLIASIVLAAVALLKGPKPKWRWGKDKNDNLDEDL